ncbi:MAG: hypothetical protein J7M29_13170 [Verrucomicrobia bacterium]|nr:hypothetical protein [Verrucomicrobiota bacterium]
MDESRSRPRGAEGLPESARRMIGRIQRVEITERCVHRRLAARASHPRPRRAALYAGVAYLRTALCLIFPWFLVSGYLAAFAWTARNAVPIIWRFTFYISAARDRPAAPGF